MPVPSISVWDLPLRLFHWALAVSVSGATATGFFGGPEILEWHIGFGLVAGGLVLARIVWGFTGTTHARFSDFLPSPQGVVEHLRRDAPRHLGHNPVGALMVFALIGCMLVICASGLVVLGGIFKTGPLAFWSFDAGLTGREVHEGAAWAVVGLVALHLAGVVFESRRSDENLARSMLTGLKEARPGDHPVRDLPARSLLAVFFVLLAGAGLWSADSMLITRKVEGLHIAFDTTTRAECSACHMAYHPSLLPATSWQALMADLPDHFGEDASLDPGAAAQIEAWLTGNAADTADTLPAHAFAATAPTAPFTVTATPFWQSQHGDMPDAVFARATVKSRSNCVACHADAESGLFSPFSIRVLKE